MVMELGVPPLPTNRTTMDVEALRRYVRSLRRRASRAVEPAGAERPAIAAEAALRYRASATHLDRRLARSRAPLAAWGGLQDSAPRAALLSMHARVDALTSDAWEDPALAQIWFRGADYLIPRDDIPIFTLGCLPRDPTVVAALEQAADALLRSRAGQQDLLRVQGFSYRLSQVTGRFLIRWDASRTTVIPNHPPDMDSDARRELARRFLHWYAPAATVQFAKWSGTSLEDARETWSEMKDETFEVDFGGERRFVLAADMPALTDAEPVHGVRFLPPSDPYLYLDSRLIPGMDAVEDCVEALRGRHASRLLNSLSGRVTMAGNIVGAWGRVSNRLSIATLPGVTRPVLDEIEAEGQQMRGPIGRAMKLVWL